MTVLLVALGAAVGAPLRYLTDLAVQRWLGAAFPWGTLVVNVAGSFVLGFAVGLPAPPAVAAVVGTGFCGALTTYSTFGYETLRLARAGRRRHAVVNVLGSVAAGLSAAYAGILLAGAV